MENEITINIPPTKNRQAPIFIHAILLRHSYDGRNRTIIFNIAYVEPDNAEIPTTSIGISENLAISLSKTKIYSSNWRIGKYGNDYVLKTYPNSSNMILDKKFDIE